MHPSARVASATATAAEEEVASASAIVSSEREKSRGILHFQSRQVQIEVGNLRLGPLVPSHDLVRSKIPLVVPLVCRVSL